MNKPNFIFILADDLGYGDVGCYNKDSKIPTPNLDALAKSGVRCTNGYVSGPYCSPTRAGLLTGRYGPRFGHEFNPGGGGDDIGLPLTETTMALRRHPRAPREMTWVAVAVGAVPSAWEQYLGQPLRTAAASLV